jgi:hypothetical protein
MYVTIVRIKLRFSKDLMKPFYYYRSYALTTGAKNEFDNNVGINWFGCSNNKKFKFDQEWNLVYDNGKRSIDGAMCTEF